MGDDYKCLYLMKVFNNIFWLFFFVFKMVVLELFFLDF